MRWAPDFHQKSISLLNCTKEAHFELSCYNRSKENQIFCISVCISNVHQSTTDRLKEYVNYILDAYSYKKSSF